MVAQVHAYWACFIFHALATGLACASGNLAGGGLYSAVVAALPTFYIACRTCVVNADKDCRPRIDLHRRKSRSIESMLEEHSRTTLRKEDALQTKVTRLLEDLSEIIARDVVTEEALNYWSKIVAEYVHYELP